MAFMVASEMIDDHLYSKEDIEKLIPAPVLTEIPSLPTPTEQHADTRSKINQLAALATMVVFTAAGFAATFLFG
jgi:predicted secreted protein